MIEMRIYHWHPAAFFAFRGGAWALMRNLLKDGGAVEKDFNVERAKSQERAEMLYIVRNQQCQWVPDLFPIAWQENASPHLECDRCMDNAWENSGSRGCKL
eukprot:8761608-Pyramimonas_sp.AAC.1